VAPKREERRLAAILATDMVGYSRLMEADESGTIARQRAHRGELIDPEIAAHNGRIVKTMGDGLLVEFASVVDATECAVAIQRGMKEREAEEPEGRRIEYRIGINLGDIIIDGDDILGDGVNVASRLEGLAEPGGVCISDVVHQSVDGKLDLSYEDLGEQKVKNISKPVRTYRVRLGEFPAVAPAAAEPALELPDKPSIAVLPFDNMSGDPEQEYFSDGIAEDIITGLSHMQGIFVIARNSSFTYKGQAVDVKRVGRELGVRYVLEGSVRRGGERVRVTAQLIEAQTGGHVWADRYDGTLEDVFTLQDDITAKVLSAIGPEITLAEIQRARTERSDSVDAWDRYLRALPLFYAINKAGYEEATKLLWEAVEIDPRFSSAYAALAQCYVHAGVHAWESSARDAISKAEEYARKAVELDLQDPSAHVALGWVHQVKTEQDRSVNELKRALELNPNLSIAYGRLSNALAFLGRPDEALAAAERANRGSPRDPERYVWFMGIMNAHFAAERYEDCVEAAEQTILLQPNFYGAYFVSAMALPYLGRIEEAEEALRTALKLMPRLTLKNTARNPMYVREDDVARMLDGLRRAGLRE
jgi:adenylate cyclase